MQEKYRTNNLVLKSAPLGTGTQLLIVRSFKDLTKGRIFLSAFNSSDSAEILGTIPSEYEECLISPANFATLFKEKDIETYLKFYKANY